MTGFDETKVVAAGIPDTDAARAYIEELAGDDCPWQLTDGALDEIDRLRELVVRQRAALGLLVEWSLDALPKVKAAGGGEYTLMPGAVVLIGRTFGPFQEGERWSDDEQMPVMQSSALFDRLDVWHAERWPGEPGGPPASMTTEPFRVDLGQLLGLSDVMRWDGSGQSQAKIVTWTNAAVSGWYGAEGSPTGQDRYFLRAGDDLFEVGDLVVRRAGTEGPYHRVSAATWEQLVNARVILIGGPLAQIDDASAILDVPDMEDRS